MSNNRRIWMNIVARLPLPPRVYRRVLKTRKRLDPYRETSLRYIGYANEIGEALENYLPDWGLPASYCVTGSYVLFDTLDKSQQTYETSDEKKLEETLFITTETLCWHLFASYYWPGGVIGFVVNTIKFLSGTDNNSIPTVMSILMIPYIIRPIDEIVDKLVENIISKLIRGKSVSLDDVNILLMNVYVPPVLLTLITIIKKFKT
jgi:hypothetical protein